MCCWFGSSRVRVLPHGGRVGVGVRPPGFSDDVPHLLHRHALLRQQDLTEGSTFKWLTFNKGHKECFLKEPLSLVV